MTTFTNSQPVATIDQASHRTRYVFFRFAEVIRNSPLIARGYFDTARLSVVIHENTDARLLFDKMLIPNVMHLLITYGLIVPVDDLQYRVADNYQSILDTFDLNDI